MLKCTMLMYSYKFVSISIYLSIRIISILKIKEIYTQFAVIP